MGVQVRVAGAAVAVVERGTDHPAGDPHPGAGVVPGPGDLLLQLPQRRPPRRLVRGLDLPGHLRRPQRPQQGHGLHRGEHVVPAARRGPPALPPLLGGDRVAAFRGGVRFGRDPGGDAVLHAAIGRERVAELLPGHRVAPVAEQGPHALLGHRPTGQPLRLGEPADPPAGLVPGLQVVPGEVLARFPRRVVARDLAHEVTPARRADALRAHRHGPQRRAPGRGCSASGRSPVAKGVERHLTRGWDDHGDGMVLRGGSVQVRGMARVMCRAPEVGCGDG